MNDSTPQNLIPAPHGTLEAIYRPRRDDAAAVAVLLHPHPQYGGNMHNKVIFRSAKALEELDFETLRFNFRGVGASTGSYDNGRGEVDDAVAALEFLRIAQPAAQRCIVLGFSFGAGIAFALDARRRDIAAVIAIGTPAYALALPGAAETARHTTFIHGEDDAVAPITAVRTAQSELGLGGNLVAVPGADHFFTDHLAELHEAVRSAAVQLSVGPPAGRRIMHD